MDIIESEKTGSDPDGDLQDRLKDVNITTKTSTHVGWQQEANLGPASAWSKIPTEDADIASQYQALQYHLFELGYPETVDRTRAPRAAKDAPSEKAVVAVLHNAGKTTSICLEGGRQAPGTMYMILSSSWLSKVPSVINRGLYTLYVHKAVTFHAGGTTYIDEFELPRRVTYLVNYFTHAATEGQKNDGKTIEENLDCPMSTSHNLRDVINDRIWSRSVLHSVGITTPETLAFCYKPKHSLVAVPSNAVIHEYDRKTSPDFVAKEVSTFLQELSENKRKMIIIRQSKRTQTGSSDASVFSIEDLSCIVDAVLKMLNELQDSNSILVEAYIDHLSAGRTEDAKYLWAAPSADVGIRCRAIVCRDFDNTPVCTPLICSMINKNIDIRGEHTVPMSIETAMKTLNIVDETFIWAFQTNMRAHAEAALQSIMDHESKLPVEERAEPGAQTDLIGIDYVFTECNGKVTAVALNIDTHKYITDSAVRDNFNSFADGRVVEQNRTVHPVDKLMEAAGHDISYKDISVRKVSNENKFTCGGLDSMSVRPFVRTVLTRSQYFLMSGKTILALGAGGFSKMSIWTFAEKSGINLVMVDSNPEHSVRDMAHTFICYDISDHTNDRHHAAEIVNLLKQRDIQVDGCLTFWEDAVPLAAMVREILGTRGANVEGALNAKKKSRTQSTLYKKDTPIPHLVMTCQYSSPSFLIREPADIDAVCNQLSYPLMLKLEHGNSAIGVSLVSSAEELRKQHRAITDCLRKEADHPGVGLGHGAEMLVMEYHGGSEHDVDIVIYGNKLVGAFISDNGPTNFPSFTETATTMPSVLPPDRQSQLIVAAFKCCVDVGLSDGVFNVEMKMTARGPKLIEINGRMGGFYLRNWIRRLHGVDLAMSAFMISCDMKPYVPKIQPHERLMGVMVLPSLHSHLVNNNNFRERIHSLKDNGEVLFKMFDDQIEVAEHEEPYGHFGVCGTDPDVCRQKLLALCNELKIECDTYKVSNFVRYFRY
ncbi:carnosine synthase 1-like isoform X2 [Dreissena polymorpha]|uniref:carnosine synthase 1-like isoform X2 n=1 Tax=Dreissena polymorpha TaxID=45954 RepID=UPI002265084D|nr:carnosine synthase 1-like isoform X2 [Dreissena polymorpha]